jgi:hypothetical protein
VVHRRPCSVGAADEHLGPAALENEEQLPLQQIDRLPCLHAALQRIAAARCALDVGKLRQLGEPPGRERAERG